MNTPQKPGAEVDTPPNGDGNINVSRANTVDLLEDAYQIKEREALAQKLGAEFVSAFHCDRAYVKRNGKYFFIDCEGNRINDLEYDYVRNFKEDRAVVGRLVEVDDKYTNQWGEPRNKTYKYSYIDLNGDLINDEEYDSANDFSEGLAAVGVDPIDKKSYTNTNGVVECNCKTNYYITPDGQVAFNGRTFTSAGNFSEGLAAVSGILEPEDIYDHDEEGNPVDVCYMDKTGKVVIKGPFYDGGEFKNGYAEATEYCYDDCDEECPQVIDREGKTILSDGFGGNALFIRLKDADRPCEFVTCDTLDSHEYAAYMMDPEDLSVVNFMHWYRSQPHLRNRPGETIPGIPEPEFPQVFGKYTLNNAEDAHNLDEKISKRDEELKREYILKKIKEDQRFTPYKQYSHTSEAIEFIRYIKSKSGFTANGGQATDKFLSWYTKDDKTFPQMFGGHEINNQQEADEFHGRIHNMALAIKEIFKCIREDNPLYSHKRFKGKLRSIREALSDLMHKRYIFDNCEFPVSCTNLMSLSHEVVFNSLEEANAVKKRLEENPDEIVAIALEYLKKNDGFNVFTAANWDYRYEDQLPYHMYYHIEGKGGRCRRKWHSTNVFYNGYEISEGRMSASDADGHEWFYVDEKGERVGTNSFRFGPPKPFKNGVAVVYDDRGPEDPQNSTYTLVNKNGEYVTDRTFEHIGKFENGVARAKLDGKIVYIDTGGNVVFQAS